MIRLKLISSYTELELEPKVQLASLGPIKAGVKPVAFYLE